MHRPEASGSAGTGNWNRIWVLKLALLLQAGKKRNGLCHFESCLSNLMAQKTQQLWLCGSWRADGKLINQRRISLPAALVSLSQAVPPSKNPAELCQVGGWQALEGQSAVEASPRVSSGELRHRDLGLQPPTRGPQVLAHFSIYQGNPFWAHFFFEPATSGFAATAPGSV